MATETKSCQRELAIEIPAEVVERETERVTRQIARMARLPGFRPGKAPAQLVRQRFWGDIREQVLHSLIPTYLENAFQERKWTPVGDPAIHDLEFEPQKPLRFRAVFEVLPEIELGDYKGLEVEAAHVELSEEDLEHELEALRERAATYEPVEGRAAEDGDTVVAHLVGVVTEPKEQREPIVLEEALVHIAAEATLEAFSASLRGARAGEERQFSVAYPEDFPQANLAGRTVAFTARVKSLKRKKLPGLDDEFARQVSDAPTLEELKAKLRERLEQARAEREKELTRQRLLDALLARHDFPVPEALLERQMDARLERQVRGLLAQGIDPRRMDVDWRRVRRGGREAAEREARLGLLLECIAEAEGIAARDDDLNREIERLAAGSQLSPEALRARLTKEGGLVRIKSAIRSEKVVEFLLSHARLSAPGRA
ncbi:MAG: trigger factor [Acidobacteria bacterium]|nr:trigger factor [Acidobacteriota bacterium]